MRRPYIARLWVQLPDGSAVMACQRRFRRLEGARRKAETWMARRAYTTTRDTYRRDRGRQDWAEVHCPRGLTLPVEPKAVIVPSVGELGYSP